MKTIRFLFALISIGNITLFASDKVFSCNYLQNKDKDIILLSDTIVLDSTIRTYYNRPFNVVTNKDELVFKQIVFNPTNDTLTIELISGAGNIAPVFHRDIAPMSSSDVFYRYLILSPVRKDSKNIILQFKKKHEPCPSEYYNIPCEPEYRIAIILNGQIVQTNKDNDTVLLADTIVLNSTIRTFCNKPFDVVSKKNVIVFKQVIFNQTKDTLTLDFNTIDGYIIPVFPREIAPLSISVVDYYYSVIMPSREENTLIYLNFKKKKALEASDYRYTIYLVGQIEKTMNEDNK